MARRWEEFTEPGTARIAKLHVSMSPTGTMLLSRNAHEALRRPSHVVLLWDAETDTVGIRAVPPRTVNAFQLYPSTSGECRFHARRFLLKYDIRLDHTVRFPTAVIENDVLILELKYRVRSPHSAHVRLR
ncbi:MAG: hypothetical protein WKF34_09600 [Pyrinomonadaceae bacterium]